MSFADIIGHGTVVEVLRRSIRTGKMPHAYIFEGRQGTGRRTTALELVKAIFCRQGDDSCGTCPSCRKVSAGNHGDVHILEPLPDKRDIIIDQLRELQRELSLRPVEAPRKVCLMEPAERMNQFSANSFLKTLEEPPGNALIILLTENADMLLPTIRSRCQLIRFSGLSPENLARLLERGGMEPQNAALAAQMADGSVQRALELDDEGLLLRREQVLGRLGTLSLSRIATIFDTSEELGGTRDETIEILDMLVSFFRDMVHLSAGAGDIVNTAESGRLTEIARRIGLERALAMTADILEARRAVQRNANVKLALDCLFMKLADGLA